MSLSDKEKVAYTLSMLRRAVDARLSWPVSPAEAAALIAERDTLVAEVERLRADLDALSRAVGQALVAASLAADETLADPIPHIIVSTVTRLRAEALGQRAEVSYLRACVPPARPSDYGHEAWTEAVRAENAAAEARIVAWLRRKHLDTREHDGSDNAVSLTLSVTADRIERGEHRREEER